MYAKIFRQIYDSSIADSPLVRFTFMDLLVLADSDGVVDMTHEAIARTTNRPLGEIRETITVLEQPDQRSRTKDHNGARISRLDEHRDWGWVILNYDKFRDIATDQQRREGTRERVRKHRANRSKQTSSVKCNASVTPCNASVTPPYVYVDAVTVQDQKGGEGGKVEHVKPGNRLPVSVDDAILQCSLDAIPATFVSHCYNQAVTRGWVDARSIQIHNFPAYVRVCFKFERERVFELAQKNGKHSEPKAFPETKLKALQNEIDSHPSNKESAHYKSTNTEAQKKDLKELRKKLQEINSQIARA